MSEMTILPYESMDERPPEAIDMNEQHSVHPEHALEVRRHLLGVESARSAANLFGVLADPTRLQVVHALVLAPTGELCVRDLAIGMERDDTTISHQLRVLRDQRIVAARKVGRVVYYRLIDKHIRQLIDVGLSHANESPLEPAQRERRHRHDA